MKQPKIIIAGGGGFLGKALARALTAREHEVVILGRHPLPPGVPARFVPWDGRTPDAAWVRELEGAAGIVNLTGKNVNCRYTPAALREINASRVDSVRAVGEALRRCHCPPAVWVQAGSLAIYGDAGEHECDETTSPGAGVPVDTCLLWESAFAAEETPGTRKVLHRISFVLGRQGGALRLLETLTRCFLGGAVGSGRQYISWIHEQDMVRLWERSLEDPRMCGTYNATSPGPVPNALFMRELRRALGRPWSPPTPAWLVPVGAGCSAPSQSWPSPDVAACRPGCRQRGSSFCILICRGRCVSSIPGCEPPVAPAAGGILQPENVITMNSSIATSLIFTHLDDLLRLAAVLQAGLAVLSLFLPRLLHWQEDLARMSLLVREVFVIHSWFISLTLLIWGVLTWRFAPEMAHAPRP